MKTRIVLWCVFFTGWLVKVNATPVHNRYVPAKKHGSTYHSTAKPVNRRSMSVEEMTKNVEFAFASDQVRSDYDDQLDQLAKLLVDSKQSLLLRGHADAIGNYIKNWKLSDRRAKTVKDYLVKKGVIADKIVTSPFGSTIPIATNKTAAGRKKNRRVEIKLS